MVFLVGNGTDNLSEIKKFQEQKDENGEKRYDY